MHRNWIGAVLLAGGLMLSAGAAADGLSPATKRLFDAVWADDMGRVKASIVDGADLSATNEFGVRAVDLAVDKGHYDIAHYLLSVEKLREDSSTSTRPVSPPALVPAPPPYQPAPTPAPVVTVAPAPASQPVIAPVPSTSVPTTTEPPPQTEKIWKPPSEGQEVQTPRLNVIGTVRPEPGIKGSATTPTPPVASPSPAKPGKAPNVESPGNNSEKPGFLEKMKGFFKFSSQAKPQTQYPPQPVSNDLAVAPNPETKEADPTDGKSSNVSGATQASADREIASRSTTEHVAETATAPSSRDGPDLLERVSDFFRSGDAPPKNAETTPPALDTFIEAKGDAPPKNAETTPSANGWRRRVSGDAPPKNAETTPDVVSTPGQASTGPPQGSTPTPAPPVAPPTETPATQSTSAAVEMPVPLSRAVETPAAAEAGSDTGATILDRITNFLQPRNEPVASPPTSELAKTAANGTLPAEASFTPLEAAKLSAQTAETSEATDATEVGVDREPTVLDKITDFLRAEDESTAPETVVPVDSPQPESGSSPAEVTMSVMPVQSERAAPTATAPPTGKTDLLSSIAKLFQAGDNPAVDEPAEVALAEKPTPETTVADISPVSSRPASPESEVKKLSSEAVIAERVVQPSASGPAIDAPDTAATESGHGFFDGLKQWLERDEPGPQPVPVADDGPTLKIIERRVVRPPVAEKAKPEVAARSAPMEESTKAVSRPPEASVEPEVAAVKLPAEPGTITRRVKAPRVGPPVQNPARVRSPMVASAALKDVRFSLGGAMRLGEKSAADNSGQHTCVEKSRWDTEFCIEPVKWPVAIAPSFRAESSIYRGEKAIVQYVNGRSVQLHALFPTLALWAVSEYFKAQYGPPTEMPEVWTALIGAPKRPNRVLRWHSRDSKTGAETLLEIREIDDLRWSAPPDTKHGVVRILEKGRGSVFQLLSATDLLLVNLRKHTQ